MLPATRLGATAGAAGAGPGAVRPPDGPGAPHWEPGRPPGARQQRPVTGRLRLFPLPSTFNESV